MLRQSRRVGVRVVPRPNSSQPSTTTRTRRAARPTSESTVDAAADMSSSSAGESSGDEPNSPTYLEIAEAAYLLYLQRGGADGRDFDDWLEAERELKARRHFA
jgi:Protein of unknown function (DUF2934)